MLDPLVQRFEAGIYQLWNNDVVALTKGASEDDIDVYIRHVKQHVQGRPAVFGAAQSVAPPGCLLRLARHRDRLGRLRQRWPAATWTIGARPMRRRRRRAKSGAARIEQRYCMIEPGRPREAGKGHRQRRPCQCAAPPAGLCDHSRRQARADLTELFFSMPFLAQTVAPGYNVTADKWLFQHLARVLDARMLALMPRQDYQPMLKNASLNLSLATVLTPEFLDFDHATNNKDRGPLAIELPAIDFFSEPEDFAFARDFLKERGYKIILDQVKYQLLPQTRPRPARRRSDQGDLDAGFLRRLRFDPAGERMQAAIERFGRERIILCRVDSEQGLEIGGKLGISLFQGRLLDAMAQGKAATAEAAKA